MRRVGRWLSSFRFTLVTEGLLLGAALLTRSYTGGLSSEWLARLGFAPADLLTPDFWRILTSAVVTDGLTGLLSAMAAVGTLVGAGEWWLGTRRTALTFWGVHVSTLLAESLLFAFPLHGRGSAAGSAIMLARDVGPSAGYYGVLGALIARLKRPWNWIAGVAIMAGLAATLLRSLTEKRSGAELSAALAHLIAFPLGIVAFRLFLRTRSAKR